MIYCLRVLTVALFVFIAAADVAADWKAGVARRIITPPQPTWMSGYASRKEPSQGTLHHLWVKSLVLTDEDRQSCAMVTLDLVGISRPFSQRVCQRIMETHGLHRSQICLATSHTHTGPVVGENLGAMYFLDDDQRQRVVDYEQWLEDEVVRCVDDAFRWQFAARLSFGNGQATFAVNRRNNREADVPDLRAAGTELVGPVDHDLPVFRVDDKSGTPRAILFGYACHATTLGFQQWSGDWPGFAQIEIEKRYPSATALFFAGCGADQNPLPRRTVELAENYGRQVADAVDELFATDMDEVAPVLETAYREIELAFERIPSRDELTSTLESENRYEVSRAKQLLQELDQTGKIAETYPYPVQTWRLGDDISFVMLGGEVVVDYSLRLKDELPGNVIVGGYMNDVMAYIPSHRVLKEGGYEGVGAMLYYGLPSAWSESVEEEIVAEVKRQALRTPSP